MCVGCPPQEAIDRLKAAQAKAPVNLFDRKVMRDRLPDPALRAEVYHDLQRYGKLTARVQHIIDNPPRIPAREMLITSAGITEEAVATLANDPGLRITDRPAIEGHKVWHIRFLDPDDADFMDHLTLVKGFASTHRPLEARRAEESKQMRRALRRSTSKAGRWVQ
jgi:hypothetical protein